MQEPITQEIPTVVEVVATTRAAGVTTGGQQQLQQLRQLQPGSPATASPTAASTATHLRPCSEPSSCNTPCSSARTSPPLVSSYSPPLPSHSQPPPYNQGGCSQSYTAPPPHLCHHLPTTMHATGLQSSPLHPLPPPAAQTYPGCDCNQDQQYNQQWSQGYHNQGRRPPYRGTVTVELLRNTRGAQAHSGRRVLMAPASFLYQCLPRPSSSTPPGAEVLGAGYPRAASALWGSSPTQGCAIPLDSNRQW